MWIKPNRYESSQHGCNLTVQESEPGLWTWTVSGAELPYQFHGSGTARTLERAQEMAVERAAKVAVRGRCGACGRRS